MHLFCTWPTRMLNGLSSRQRKVQKVYRLMAPSAYYVCSALLELEELFPRLVVPPQCQARCCSGRKKALPNKCKGSDNLAMELI